MDMESLPKYIPETIAIKLSPDAERVLKQQNHPWIFSESLLKINKKGSPGDIAIIFGNKQNKVLGVGLYDPDSPIRVKMLYFGGAATINENFFREKIVLAFSKRKELLTEDTNSYRLIFGENDGFPGVIADVYARVLVIKLYTPIWLPYLTQIVPLLSEISGCETVVLRLSRNMQSQPGLHLKDGDILSGQLISEEIEFKEHGIKFKANVIKGHKTGFFLDHRENRRKVGLMSKDKKVLDVFSYAGGFSVHALAGGAREVTSVDISAQALEVAHQNVTLNHFEGRHNTMKGDAFEMMRSFIQRKIFFDLVIIDPPSFAKSKTELVSAKRKYAQLALSGSQVLSKKGILVLASCTSRVTAEEFFQINEETLNATGRHFKCIEKTYHDIDHPVTFKEGAYLKCGYYKAD